MGRSGRIARNMKKQITRIAPLQSGIVLGTLYGILGLIFCPIGILISFLPHKAGTPDPGMAGMVLAILFPIMYAFAGFIGGIIASAVYNLGARFTGGLHVEVQDLPYHSH